MTDPLPPAEPTPAAATASHASDDRVRPEDAVAGPGGVIRQFGRGFTMGSADLVPGVSGGTMALVFGIYDPLVGTIGDAATAVGHLLRLDVSAAMAATRRVSWRFLLPLLVGIGTAIVVLVGPLTSLLEHHPVVMSAAFFGLIVGSVAVTMEGLRTRDVPRLSTLAAVALGTFFMLGLRGGSIGDPTVPVLFAGGALAVCAMILPGISGSLILVIIGLYDAVLTAVHDRDLLALAAVALGAAIGLALFSKVLSWLLEHHRETVMAALIGLMVGSLRVLWMWPSTDGVEDVRLGAPVLADVPEVVAASAIAAIVVIILARIGRVETA